MIHYNRPTAATFRTFTKPIGAIGVTRVTLKAPEVKLESDTRE